MKKKKYIIIIMREITSCEKSLWAGARAHKFEIKRMFSIGRLPIVNDAHTDTFTTHRLPDINIKYERWRHHIFCFSVEKYYWNERLLCICVKYFLGVKMGGRVQRKIQRLIWSNLKLALITRNFTEKLNTCITTVRNIKVIILSEVGH